VSKTFDALIKAEAESRSQKRQKRRGVNFSALSVFKDKGRPIKIDFDLDPYVEEQYHRLRRHLLPNSKHGATKVVMVAATDHGEGGTTTAAILASTIARSGNSKILLVDANLRTPALDEVFEQGQGSKLMGLSDKVLAEVPLDQTIYQTDIPNLSFMPCGKAVTSPSYMFDSEPIVSMLAALREQFDFIIFDGSPLRDYSESSFLAGKMDGVILVVEAERTKIDVARKIRKDLESTGVQILGVVLNKKRNYIPEYLERFL
jgi:capsular exopolysaccharide synthesis family protein